MKEINLIDLIKVDLTRKNVVITNHDNIFLRWNRIGFRILCSVLFGVDVNTKYTLHRT